MRLVEAVLAGAARVDGRRCRDVYVWGSGQYACAVGAAFLGCHPDVSAGSERLAAMIDDWLFRNDVLDEGASTPLRGWARELADFNDRHPAGDFTPVVRFLVERRLADVELIA